MLALLFIIAWLLISNQKIECKNKYIFFFNFLFEFKMKCVYDFILCKLCGFRRKLGLPPISSLLCCTSDVRILWILNPLLLILTNNMIWQRFSVSLQNKQLKDPLENAFPHFLLFFSRNIVCYVIKKGKGIWVFATNLNFLISLTLQNIGVSLWYFKLW